MSKFGVGTYTTKTGQKIHHSQLPPEVQNEIESMAARRAARGQPSAGGEPNLGGAPNDNTMEQERVKRLYDPATREAEMGRIQAERVSHVLVGRLAQRR